MDVVNSKLALGLVQAILQYYNLVFEFWED
jgi:hypothetical protein